MDNKEYARQMRENAVKNPQGIVQVSPELWEEIASRIEKSILLPCEVGDEVYYISGKYEKRGRGKAYIKFVDVGIVDNITIGGKGVPQIEVCNSDNVWTTFDAEDDFGKIVFRTHEELEQALRR